MKLELPEELNAIFTGTHDTIAQLSRSLSIKDQKEEYNRLQDLKKRLEEIGKKNSLDIVLVTGNSFDWVRGRILEPYSFYGIPRVNVIVISENGLVAQSRDDGVYWVAEPSEEYKKSVAEIEKYATKKFPRMFWLQGNMKRTTFKPTIKQRDRFDNEFVPEIIDYAKNLNIITYDPKKGFGDEIGVMYHHKGSSLDIDPRKVMFNQEEVDFRGKQTAIEMFSKIKGYEKGKVVSIGRSRSDIPMFEAVIKSGGRSFIPTDNEFSDIDMAHLKNIDVRQLGVESKVSLQTVLKKYIDR